ncbi:hypothetical protein H1R20_g1444, partial [Candolleomyces eurysporus]
MDPLLTTVLSGSYAETTNLTLLRETLVNVSRYARALEAALPPGTLSKRSSHSPPTDSSSPSKNTESNSSPEPDITIKEEVQEIKSLSETFKRSMALSGSGDRFFGPSSSFALIDSAASEVAHFGGDANGSGLSQRSEAMTASGVKQHMRPVFWKWEKAPPPDNRPFDFPEPDLLEKLVELYFDNVNFYMPLLHRPTIDRGLKEGLHLSDPGFAGVALAMCALGARYANDERVLLEGTNSLHSSGFKWFRQIRLFGEFSLRAPSLYELQALCLAVNYVQGSSTQEKAWYMIGLGIRAAQDIGLNHKDGNTKPTVEGELRKRIFWHLLLSDSITASAVGRPPAIHLSDFDVDLPIECDDEYWENADPEKAFKQPPGMPSKVSYFCALLRLLQIHCKSHRAFYSVKPTEPPQGYTAEEWNRMSLSNLDSALNEWVDSLPDHLRWDPTNSHGALLDQSAALFCTYYTTQMLAHRLFVASRDHPALAFSSLAICTNAARACIRIMETQSKKGHRFAPQIMKALATSALMLILNICGSRRTGFPVIDETKEIGLVHTCINVLSTFEDRWHSAGRYRDILIALTSTGGLQPKTSSPNTSRRRSHRALECECDAEPTAARQQRSFPPVTAASTAPKTSSADRPDSQGSSQTHGNTGASVEKQAPAPNISAQFESARPDALLDAIPLYSSDLSKPFPLFDEANHSYDATWKQQLDELQALWDQTANSGGQSVAAGTGLSIQDMSSVDNLFVDSLASTSFDVPHPPSSSKSVLTASAGLDVGSIGPSSTAPTAAPIQQAPMFDFGSSVLDPQGAALWVDVPSTYNMDEWGSYISNVNTLNTVPTQQYHQNATLQAAPVQGINFGFMTGRSGMAIKQYLRPEYWSVLPWEQAPPPDDSPFDFPEPDLLDELIRLHFNNCNFLLPLLHRPTVERWIKEGKHLSDPGIGGVVVGLCALGARFSSDPRVLLEGTTSLHSNGFKWFRQMRVFPESCLHAPTLYDMQSLCLVILYLLGSSTPEKCWYYVGFGIRAAQDIGLNRKGAATKPTVERELRNRVFWMLFIADSVTSAAIGRPSAIDLNDIDVEMPVECDDEYWEHPDPELAFKQPPVFRKAP